MNPQIGEALAAAAEDARRLTWEHERADLIGTERPGLDELKDLSGRLDGLAAAEVEPEECDCFDGLRWTKMSQAERRYVLTWLSKMAQLAPDDESWRPVDLEAAIEALQAVCETEGVR